MELLSNAPVHHDVPENYVLPPEKRPGDDELVVDPSVTLPVIDLRGALRDRRRHVVDEIINAGKEFGFFQVVNHGVGEEVVRGFREAAAEFFGMPAEEKLRYYSDDTSRAFRVDSSTPYDRSVMRHWRDYLKLQCFPVEKFIHQWPPRPEKFRECLATYTVEVQELARMLLRLIAEGLGLDGNSFLGDLSSGETEMAVNYYPPCPDPSLTLGLPPHCDRHLLTVLSQGDVSGLQAMYKGRWITVKPIPNAFVVNIAHQMEIVSNGVLKAMEHRAVTNSAAARLSVALLIMPKTECRIAPAPEMVNEEKPAKYRAFLFSEFVKAYDAAAADREGVLQYFKLYKEDFTFGVDCDD